jgi:hypothetical protein
LGEPVTMMPTIRFLCFLWKKDFNLLPDEELVVVGRCLRFFFICQTVLWMLMGVLFAVCVYNHPLPGWRFP